MKLLSSSTKSSRLSMSVPRNGMGALPTIMGIDMSYLGGFQPSQILLRSQLLWKVEEERRVRKLLY
jgi:hypothetical protein